MLVSDVAVDLNVLGGFIEDIVMNNVDSTTFVISSSVVSFLRSFRFNSV